MSIVKINALDVPQGKGPELEARFASRPRTVDDEPGFEGFQLLRPVSGDDRYFVMTTWRSQADFDAWRAKAASGSTDSDDAPKPVATGAHLIEFEVVNLAQ